MLPDKTSERDWAGTATCVPRGKSGKEQRFAMGQKLSLNFGFAVFQVCDFGHAPQTPSPHLQVGVNAGIQQSAAGVDERGARNVL